MSIVKISLLVPLYLTSQNLNTCSLICHYLGCLHNKKQIWKGRTRIAVGSSATHTSWITSCSERLWIAKCWPSRCRTSQCKQYCRSSQETGWNCQVQLHSFVPSVARIRKDNIPWSFQYSCEFCAQDTQWLFWRGFLFLNLRIQVNRISEAFCLFLQPGYESCTLWKGTLNLWWNWRVSTSTQSNNHTRCRFSHLLCKIPVLILQKYTGHYFVGQEHSRISLINCLYVLAPILYTRQMVIPWYKSLLQCGISLP